jgi:hypothetical protein
LAPAIPPRFGVEVVDVTKTELYGVKVPVTFVGLVTLKAHGDVAPEQVPPAPLHSANPDFDPTDEAVSVTEVPQFTLKEQVGPHTAG